MECAFLANSEVQPLILPMPRAWAGDPELVSYHNELQRVIELFYREAFWVNTRTSADITAASRFVTPIHREHIICTNTGTSSVTVTLNDGSDSNHPFEDQQVMVTRYGGGPVTIDAGNKTILGLSTINLSSSGDSSYLKWSDEDDEWLIV